MNLPIIQKKFWFVGISTLFVVTSIAFYGIWGLNLGIDFTGGSLLELRFGATRPSIEEVEKALTAIDVKSLTVQPTDQNGLILRFQNTDEAKHQEVVTKIKALVDKDEKATKTDAKPEVKVDGTNVKNVELEIDAESQEAPLVQELRFESVGPSIGRQLRSNAITSLLIIAVLIVAYIAWTFRKVSRPVASWKYGLAGIIAIGHDVIITVGAFAWLGHFYGIEVGVPFVAALLTIFGYSINDTIVVFDRVRENLPKSHHNFEDTVNFSLNQTMKRSLYTSTTTLLTLLAIVVYGGDSVRYFALALLIGIFFGTYSSIFLASPLLVLFEKYKRK